MHQVWLQQVQNSMKLFSEDLGPSCDLDLEVRNPNISHDSTRSWCCTNIPSCIKKCWVVQKLSRQIYPEELNLNVTLTMRTAIKDCHRALSHVRVYHYTKSGCNRKALRRAFGNSGDMEETVILLRIWPRTVTLTLKRGTQPYRTTLRVMMVHNNTKFHEEGLSGWEDVRTIIPWAFGPSLWPWPWT